MRPMRVALIVEELARIPGKAKVAKVNVDEEGACLKVQIMSIPTILIFKDGNAVEKLVGVYKSGLFQFLINTLIHKTLWKL